MNIQNILLDIYFVECCKLLFYLSVVAVIYAMVTVCEFHERSGVQRKMQVMVRL